MSAASRASTAFAVATGTTTAGTTTSTGSAATAAPPLGSIKTGTALEKCLGNLEVTHNKNLAVRKRAYATIAETMEEALREIRKRIKSDPECDEACSKMSRSLMNMNCIYKENEFLYNHVYDSKVRDLRSKAMIGNFRKSMEKMQSTVVTARMKEMEATQRVENALLQTQMYQERLEEVKKRELLLERTIESMIANERRLNEMVSSMLMK